MPCLDCLEKRAKVMNMIGLGRWAPQLPQAPSIAKVADIDFTAAVSECNAPPPVRDQFARYVAASNGVTAATAIFAAMELVAFALGQACADRSCADEQVEAVCETLRRNVKGKYDDSGKRREIVMARAIY